MKLTLGFSPCPNDTFIFDALVHGKIDTQGLEFEYMLEDVETLNAWAAQGKLDITKLSFAALLPLTGEYALLRSGAALGRGVGPLLIKKPGANIRIPDSRIAIPGKNTTANLLLSLAYPEAENKSEVLFSAIEQMVLEGTFDLGLIIHESRFTYADRGLEKVLDLGEWWERETGAAIPLGGIVAKRSLDRDVIAMVDKLIAQSVAYSWQHYPGLAPFVQEHAQEMDEEVMRQHINLYVNEHTADIGPEGTQAIITLFEKAVAAGVIAKKPETVFY